MFLLMGETLGAAVFHDQIPSVLTVLLPVLREPAMLRAQGGCKAQLPWATETTISLNQ
jgi:hypothetical protein